MANVYLQEYVFNLPDELKFGVQTPASTGWQSNFVNRFLGRQNIQVTEYLNYEEAVSIFNHAEDAPMRVVRYTRYLVNDKPIVIEVVKCRT